MSAIDRIGHVVTRDAWYKLLALALAVITWLYVDAELRDRRAAEQSVFSSWDIETR